MKRSITQNQFPQIRFRDGKRLLFNPANKKVLLHRPEERVRLQLMEFLNRRGKVPYSRMSTELPVKITNDHGTLRADVLIYTTELKPELLAECKAPDIRINEAAAEQAARYNSKIGASKILLTNGLKDALFTAATNGISSADTNSLIQQDEPVRDAGFWSNRGFCGKETREEVIDGLNHFYGTDEPLFLSVAPPADDLPDLSHYYRVFNTDRDIFWAIGFLGDESGKCFVAGLNQVSGQAEGFVLLQIDHPKENTFRIISKKLDISQKIDQLSAQDFIPLKPGDASHLPELFERVIDHL